MRKNGNNAKDEVRVTIVLYLDEAIDLRVRTSKMNMNRSPFIRALVRAYLDNELPITDEQIMEYADLRDGQVEIEG